MQVMKQDISEMDTNIKIIRWEQSDTRHIVKAIINELGQLNKKINAQVKDKYVS